MEKRFRILILLTLATLVTTVDAAPLALLIGNWKYAGVENDLPSVEGDVWLLKQALEQNGYEVVYEPLLNKFNSEAWLTSVLEPTLRNALSNKTGEPVTLIYYAGHGSVLPSKSGGEIDADSYITTVPKSGKVSKVRIYTFLKSIERAAGTTAVEVHFNCCRSNESSNLTINGSDSFERVHRFKKIRVYQSCSLGEFARADWAETECRNTYRHISKSGLAGTPYGNRLAWLVSTCVSGRTSDCFDQTFDLEFKRKCKFQPTQLGNLKLIDFKGPVYSRVADRQLLTAWIKGSDALQIDVPGILSEVSSSISVASRVDVSCLQSGDDLTQFSEFAASKGITIPELNLFLLSIKSAYSNDSPSSERGKYTLSDFGLSARDLRNTMCLRSLSFDEFVDLAEFLFPNITESFRENRSDEEWSRMVSIARISFNRPNLAFFLP